MNNIETLKLELLKQKEVIEDMGGYVAVANNNPSPSEITEAIRTVAGNLDLTIATATEADVSLGKTFYAGTTKLKTGTNQSEDFYHLYLYGDCDAEYLKTPDDITTYRKYMFAGVDSTTPFIINKKVESISEYAFYYANITNISFEENCKITFIGTDAFANSSATINYSRLPDTITEMGYRPFYNTKPTSDGYLKIPKNLTKTGQYGLTSNSYYEFDDGIDWNDTALTTIYQSMFYNQSLAGELTFPSTITKIANSAFYCSRYSKVTSPANITTMENNSYCVSSSYASKVPKLEIIFEGTTPPTFTSCPFYYLNRIADLSIYVPDESYEAYCAVSALSTYVTFIKKMSELPE